MFEGRSGRRRRGEHHAPRASLRMLSPFVAASDRPAGKLERREATLLLGSTPSAPLASLTRITVPRTSTVAARRSSASQVIADASPIRSPVASIKSVKSRGPMLALSSSAWIFVAGRSLRPWSGPRGRRALDRPTSRTGLRSIASWRTARPIMPLRTVRVVLAAATPKRRAPRTSRSSRDTVNSRTRSTPIPSRT